MCMIAKYFVQVNVFVNKNKIAIHEKIVRENIKQRDHLVTASV